MARLLSPTDEPSDMCIALDAWLLGLKVILMEHWAISEMDGADATVCWACIVPKLAAENGPS